MTTSIDPARWPRLRELFERTAAMDPPTRRAFLDELADEDTDLRPELLRMLEAEEDDEGFLDPPVRTSLDVLPTPASPEARLGKRIDAYRLERVIASGGMGTVYEALQDEPRRRVALKMLRVGLRSEGRRRRFRYEAEMLAHLRHPGIAQIYDAGVHDEGEAAADPTPWFAMELVDRARSLTDYARAEGLSFENRVRLFLRIASAVHYGHQRGVIHRDLKPANLLVDGEGHTKVIDYGVARTVDPARVGEELTNAGEIVGTLRYMSPEQIAGPGSDVDARTDVYALGVVLYELLCDRAAYDLGDRSLTEVTRILCTEDPTAPTTVDSSLPDEVDWIVRRAMEKEAERRYASVSELGADLERLLGHEPVQAGPPTARYRLRKLYQRHRLAISTAAFAAVVVLVAFGGTVVGLMRVLAAERVASEERAAAIDQAEKSEAMLSFLLDGLAAPNPGFHGRDLSVVAFMEHSATIIDLSFADRPLVRAWLHQVVGRAFHALGEGPQADEHLRIALALFREHDRPETRSVPLALGDLALVCTDDGRFDEAAALLDEAEALLDGPGAAEDLDVWRVRGQRGHLLLARGERKEAEDLVRQVLQAQTELAGPDHRDTLGTRSVLGGLLHEAGRLEEAEEVYRPAFDISNEKFGFDHPDTLRLGNNLAMLLYTRGEVDEAFPRLEAVLEARGRVLGRDHPDYIGTLNNFAGLHFMESKLPRAAELYRESLGLLENLDEPLEDEHPLMQVLLVNLGTTLTQLRNYDEAGDLLRRVHATRVRTRGPNHEKTLNAQLELARLARHLEQPETCRELLEDGLDRVVTHLGEAHPLLPRFEIEYGEYFMLVDDLDSAEAILLDCQEGLRDGSRSTGRSKPGDIVELLQEIAARRTDG